MQQEQRAIASKSLPRGRVQRVDRTVGILISITAMVIAGCGSETPRDPSSGLDPAAVLAADRFAQAVIVEHDPERAAAFATPAVGGGIAEDIAVFKRDGVNSILEKTTNGICPPVGPFGVSGVNCATYVVRGDGQAAPGTDVEIVADYRLFLVDSGDGWKVAATEYVAKVTATVEH